MNKEKSCPSVGINWYPGHMAKTKRQITEMLPIIDLIYEILDARIPYSSKIADIDNIIKNKPRIIVMTKGDLCDLEMTNKWVKKYEGKGYKVVIVDLNKNGEDKKIISATEEIINKINKERQERGMKEKQIKALVIGVPNVGKSTFINKMAGKKVSSVGNTPGVTKNLVWLKTKANILLLDTPGILWPKFDDQEVALNLASMACIRNEVLDIDSVACHILEKLNKNYPNILKTRYNIDEVDSDNIELAYETIGKKIGALVSGGEVDYEKVSNFILNDIKLEHVKGITFDEI